MNIFRKIKRRWLTWKMGDTFKKLGRYMGYEYTSLSEYSKMEQSNPKAYVLRRRLMSELADLIAYDKVYYPEFVEDGRKLLELVLKMGSSEHVEE